MSNLTTVQAPYQEFVGSGMFSIDTVDRLVNQATKVALEAIKQVDDIAETELESDGSVLEQITILGCWC